MNLEDYNNYCSQFPAAHKVIQWGGSHVWKVHTKVFAIAMLQKENFPAVTFKTSELDFEILKDRQGLRPAPYLASRGMKWIQHCNLPGLEDEDLQYYIDKSFRLVSSGLSRKKQKELGILLT